MDDRPFSCTKEAERHTYYKSKDFHYDLRVCRISSQFPTIYCCTACSATSVRRLILTLPRLFSERIPDLYSFVNTNGSAKSPIPKDLTLLLLVHPTEWTTSFRDKGHNCKIGGLSANHTSPPLPVQSLLRHVHPRFNMVQSDRPVHRHSPFNPSSNTPIPGSIWFNIEECEPKRPGFSKEKTRHFWSFLDVSRRRKSVSAKQSQCGERRVFYIL